MNLLLEIIFLVRHTEKESKQLKYFNDRAISKVIARRSNDRQVIINEREVRSIECPKAVSIQVQVVSQRIIIIAHRLFVFIVPCISIIIIVSCCAGESLFIRLKAEYSGNFRL